MDVFWLSASRLRKGANAEEMSDIDGLLFAGVVTNFNGNETFVTTYQDGDGDRWLNFLGGLANMCTGNWGYGHILYEWGCLPHSPI